MEKEVKWTIKENELTDAFGTLGIDTFYFSLFKNNAIKRLNAITEYEPDQDEIDYCLKLATEYIIIYVDQIKLGHSMIWADTYADFKVSCTNDESAHKAYNKVRQEQNENQADKDLSIHAHSLCDESTFVDYYISNFHDGDTDAEERAHNYFKLFNSLIRKGKSEFYAHAYADASCGLNYAEWCRDIYSQAYELAKKHGMQDVSSHIYGDDCIEAYGQGLWLQMEQYFDIYHEDWQKDFFFQLICDEYEKKHGVEMLGLRTKQLRIEFDEHYALLMKKHVL